MSKKPLRNRLRFLFSPRNPKNSERYADYTGIIGKELLKTKYEVKSICEVGGASGLFLSKLSTFFNTETLVNVDLDLASLKNIPSIECVCADAHHLPFRQNSFDVVLAVSCLEHLQDLDLAIKEQLRVGKIVAIQLPELRHIIEVHTMFPLLYYFPASIREAIQKLLAPSFIQWRAIFPHVLSIFKGNHSIEIFRRYVYYPPLTRVLVIPTSYVSIFTKTRE